MTAQTKLYIVEHLDPELGPWSALEYQAIAKESVDSGATFCLSSVPQTLTVPKELLQAPGFATNHQSVEDIYPSSKNRICLLDPSAKLELSPDDGSRFDVFLFGGILGLWKLCCGVKALELTQKIIRR